MAVDKEIMRCKLRNVIDSGIIDYITGLVKYRAAASKS